MTTSNGWRPPPIQVIDWLFTHYNDPPAADGPFAAAPAAEEALNWEPESPPPIQDPADLRAANDWLHRERGRLRQYTETQLARIRTEHQSLVQQKYLNEQTMILGGQELTRKEELLARQSRALQQQALELSRREQALCGQLEQWSRARGELETISQVRVQTEQETAQLKSLLGGLRDETLALQKAREETQAELEAMAQALEQHREQRAADLARARANQEEMERRLRALDLAEQVAQRRVADLDDLEVRLREEFEEQERRLADQRRDVAALYARLRQPAPGAATKEPGRGTDEDGSLPRPGGFDV
jgi:hypothetical protein